MWIRRHWPKFVGYALLAWTVTVRVLGAVGSVDLVISRAQDPGWVGTVIGLVLNPSPWIDILLIVGGLGLIWWDLRRRRLPVATADEGAPAPTLHDAQSLTKLSPTLSATAKPSATSQANPNSKIADAPLRPPRREASQLLPGWETLYHVQYDSGVELAFAPDTQHPRKDAFVLLLYAYLILYGDEKVGGRRIYGDMNRNFDKVWKRFQNQQASLWEFVGSMSTKDWGQEAVDAGLVMRVDLATTPSYRLTIYGQSHAHDLAQSLIARA